MKKPNMITKLGKKLMGWGHLKICIVDDEDAYFDKDMLSTAKAAGFVGLDRKYVVDRKLYNKLLSGHYDILILDIIGSVDKDISKGKESNGLDLVPSLREHTNVYIAITSAQEMHLNKKQLKADYIIDEKHLGNVDFIEELSFIVSDYLKQKIEFYKRPLLRAGFFLAKQI